MRHTKKQENVLYTGKKRHSIKIIPEEAPTLDSLDKDFKSVTTSMFKELKVIMYKEMRKR